MPVSSTAILARGMRSAQAAKAAALKILSTCGFSKDSWDQSDENESQFDQITHLLLSEGGVGLLRRNSLGQRNLQLGELVIRDSFTDLLLLGGLDDIADRALDCIRNISEN